MSRHEVTRRLLGFIGTFVTRRPWWILVTYSVLAVASIVVSAVWLEMKTDQNDLVSSDLEYNQHYLSYLEDFGDLEYLYVVIVVDDRPELAIEIAEAVSAEVSALEEDVQEVLHRIHPLSFGDSVLLQGSETELQDLALSAEKNRSYLESLAKLHGFAGVLEFVADSVDPSVAEQDPEAAEWGFKFLDLTLACMLAAARGETPPSLQESIEDIALGPGRDPRERGYMFSGNLAVIEIMPKKNYGTLEVIRKPLVRIREALERVRRRFVDRLPELQDQYPGITADDIQFGLTGRPVLQADEMKTTNDDMVRATVLALVVVLVLFWGFFRRLRRPLLAVLALVVGISLTFGFVTATIGYLTLLSVVFTVMLIGLGIDSGVHFLARYQEELVYCGDIETAIKTTLVTTGRGIWTGGITTAAAFYSTVFVHFRGLRELGFVAGSGLLLCMITMLTFLPALVLVTDRRIQLRRGLSPPHLISIPFLRYAASCPRATIACLVGLTILGFAPFRGVPYNSNLLDLQAKGLESVEYELKFIEESDRSTWEAAFIGKSLEDVDRIIAALKPLRDDGIIGAVESVRDFVFADQSRKIEILEPVGRLLDSVRMPESVPEESPEPLAEAIVGLLDRLDHLQSLLATRGQPGDREGLIYLQKLIDKLLGLQDLLDDQPESSLERLNQYQKRWFEETRAIFGMLRHMMSPSPVTVESVPEPVRRRFVSSDGSKFLVRAYPMKDIWDERNMTEFVDAIRKVDENVTGVAIQVYESARLMKDGFLWAAAYSLIIVFFVILFDYRSLKFACLTLVPLAAGLLWTLQLMPLLGLDFNLANFFSMPILVGYGVAGGVHVIHRYREFQSASYVGATVSSAVALSFLTTIVGFGSLASARHRGIASLGIVTSLGCFTILVASVVLLPCILALSGERKQG